MTDQVIAQIVKAMNRPDKTIFIAEQPIATNVHYGLVWDDLNYKRPGDISPKQFYFIGNGKGKYIGAVYDMIGDLHWYIEPRSRKKGYLGKALKEAILPHLSRSRRKQRITIEKDMIGALNFEASLRVAKKSGFRLKGKEADKIELTQNLIPYKKIPMAIKNEGMEFQRMVELKLKMSDVVQNLWNIQAELEAKLGRTYYTRQLAGFVKELSGYRRLKLDDALYDFNETQARRARVLQAKS